MVSYKMPAGRGRYTIVVWIEVCTSYNPYTATQYKAHTAVNVINIFIHHTNAGS